MTEPLIKTRMHVEGMDCASCAAKIETAARRTAGISEASVSVANGTVTLDHQVEADLASFERSVRAMGYTVTPTAPNGAAAPLSSHAHLPDGPWWKTGKARLTIVCAIALIVAFA